MAGTMDTLQSALDAALGGRIRGRHVERDELTLEVGAKDLVAAATLLRGGNDACGRCTL